MGGWGVKCFDQWGEWDYEARMQLVVRLRSTFLLDDQRRQWRTMPYQEPISPSYPSICACSPSVKNYGLQCNCTDWFALWSLFMPLLPKSGLDCGELKCCCWCGHASLLPSHPFPFLLIRVVLVININAIVIIIATIFTAVFTFANFPIKFVLPPKNNGN